MNSGTEPSPFVFDWDPTFAPALPSRTYHDRRRRRGARYLRTRTSTSTILFYHSNMQHFASTGPGQTHDETRHVQGPARHAAPPDDRPNERTDK